MKTILLYALSFFFFPIGINAQDTVFKTDGTKIEGSVTVQNKERNDIVSIENLKIDANQVDRILFENGSELISKELTYYNSKSKIEITKYAFLKQLLDGDAELYSYDGNDFSFALYVHNKYQVLQQIPSDANTEIVQTYRITLLVNLEECAPRPEIFKTNYSRNSLVNLVNNYNQCKNGDYEAIEESVEKFRVFYFGASVGLNHATNELLLPLIDRVDGEPSVIGRVDQEGVVSTSLAIGLFGQTNILNSKSFYLKLGINARKYDFSITSFDSNIEVENLETTELDFNLGVNFKPFSSKKISPEIGFGALYSTFIHNKNIYHNTSQYYPAIPNTYVGNSSLEYFLEASINYKVTSRLFLFAEGKYIFRTGNGMIDRNGGFYFEEDLYNNYTLSLGFSLEDIISGTF